MPELSDLKVDPATGMLQNPGDFTPGQLDEARRKGLLTSQGFNAALPNAAKPAPNAVDQAAQQQANAAQDLRYGTSAAGAPAGPAAAVPPPPAVVSGASPPPGAPLMQPPAAPVRSPADAALASLVSPRTPRGPSLAADKAYEKTLEGEKQDVQNTDREGAVVTQDLLDQHRQQVDSLATESQVARLAMQDELQQQQAHRARIESETRESQRHVDDYLAKLDAQGVDPNHYWQSLGTAGSIGAAVAIGLGAFAAHPLGPRGGASENTALGIINNAIASDIDAQKTNLQKSITLAGKKMESNRDRFDHEAALLQAERESTMTAYAVAQKDVERRIALYQDNANFQMNGQKLITGLKESMNQAVAPINDRLYQLRKGMERATAGGGSILAQEREKLIADAKELRIKAAEGGKDIDPGEALRQAAALRFGVDVKPGEPFGSISKVDKSAASAGKLSPRLVNRLADLNAAEQSIGELNGLLKKGTTMSPADRSRVDLLASQLRPQYPSIPEHPLGLTEASRLTGSSTAAIAQALKDVRVKKQTLLTAGAGSGESAEDLGGEKDE